MLDLLELKLDLNLNRLLCVIISSYFNSFFKNFPQQFNIPYRHKDHCFVLVLLIFCYNLTKLEYCQGAPSSSSADPLFIF